MTRRFLVGATAAIAFLVFASAAAAATTKLGVTGPPAGATSGSCSPGPEIVAQETDDPSTPFIIPAGGGEITQWQTYTAGDTAGAGVTFAVLAPTASSGYYDVVAADTETLPSPLPANNVASFTLAPPIQVQAGDTLALYTSQNCYFGGGATPAHDTLVSEQQSGTSTVAPQAGQMLEPAGSPSGSGYVLNLAATLVTGEDAGVTSSVFPSAVQTGGVAVLSSVVTNDGPQEGTISFVDQVPSGLQVQSASAGPGTCLISGQTVDCTIAGLAVGQSTVVYVVVAASSTGSLSNQVSVAPVSPLSDPNPANNAASATLTVTAPPVATPTTTTPTTTATGTGSPATPSKRCVVPGLRRVPLSTARTVLRDLGCTVRALRRHSALGRYLVIGVRGRTGSYAYRHLVTLLVSTGPRPKKRVRR